MPGPSRPGGVYESLQKTKENRTPSATHALIMSRDFFGVLENHEGFVHFTIF